MDSNTIRSSVDRHMMIDISISHMLGTGRVKRLFTANTLWEGIMTS